ncbi:MAG: type II toxin-antitoxin system VapC family toxin [Proteobacteria bacterium]|jgi:tRNA(fMet)-specific endonuclease VapC|nr:type II toxin-antitoxin system VapC family toxin [Desulfobacterales bacterium]MBU0735128.1 type II toxin-antitoxin system VapC family toxin [Pseudomonadota bacterium]MBU1902596.1 type II toxin-antitoxin system VapC family toxin [Pseudomonadota bacterium]
MIKYLLDTNVLSEAVKALPDRYVMEMLEKHQDEIVTAAPVWHELLYGCLRLPVSRKREMLEAYLEDVVFRSMDILPYDERAAEWHAEQRSKLSLHGKMPSFVDGQIAAITSVNDLILVTRNTQDFKLFENFRVLNWHKTG